MDKAMTNLHTDVRFSIVPEWVIDANISDRAVRVYALLARYADSETLQAFPSRETLAKRAKCHWRSIDRAIDELVKLGAITKTHRKHGDSYQSNIYTLRRVLPGMSLPTDNADKRVLTPGALPTDTDGNLTRTTELEPSEQKPLNSLFDQFWSIYPVKKDKPAARRAFEKALKRTSIEVILAGAESHRNDPNREQRFTKNPSTWLNNDAWENEPEAPKEKLANWQKAALLARKYADEEHNAVEHVNHSRVRELEAETTSWLKGVDDE